MILVMLMFPFSDLVFDNDIKKNVSTETFIHHSWTVFLFFQKSVSWIFTQHFLNDWTCFRMLREHSKVTFHNVCFMIK